MTRHISPFLLKEGRGLCFLLSSSLSRSLKFGNSGGWLLWYALKLVVKEIILYPAEIFIQLFVVCARLPSKTMGIYNGM